MRLSPDERKVILEAARRHFGEAAEVWLFGSRVRDDARGGDIDLLAGLQAPVAPPLSLSLAFEADIQSELDDPKVDVLVHVAGQSCNAGVPEKSIRRAARIVVTKIGNLTGRQ